MERRTTTSAQRVGDKAEALVVARLAAAGWTLLGRNVRIGRSELDIVAVDPGPPAALVVVEVRWRNRRDFGLAEETLDFRKRSALRHAVGTLLELGHLPDGRLLPGLPLRLDLVALDWGPGGLVSVRHHRAYRP
jgi:Holliday junction resolvase-like predicted endonuclease